MPTLRRSCESRRVSRAAAGKPFTRVAARISARWTVRTPVRWRFSAPPMCIRHELSADVQTSAPRVEHVAQLVGEHRHRGVGVLDREDTTEATALARVLELDEVDALDGPQQPQRAVPDLQQPQRVTGRVVGDTVRVDGADVLDPEDVDQELGQLEDPLHAVPAQVRDARRGRRDDGLEAVEHALEALDQRVAVIGVARVGVHLPAARLRLGELDLDPEAFQQLDDRLSRPRKQRVVEARHEERGPHLVGERSLFRGGGGPPEGSRHVPAGL